MDQGERHGSRSAPRQRQASAKRRRLGQHFLKDQQVIEKILAAFAPGPGDRVLEVGPGHGALTGPLALQVATLVAVERDASLAEALKRRYQREPGVTILAEVEGSDERATGSIESFRDPKHRR